MMPRSQPAAESGTDITVGGDANIEMRQRERDVFT
jgi:hypothetical protein